MHGPVHSGVWFVALSREGCSSPFDGKVCLFVHLLDVYVPPPPFPRYVLVWLRFCISGPLPQAGAGHQAEGFETHGQLHVRLPRILLQVRYSSVLTEVKVC